MFDNFDNEVTRVRVDMDRGVVCWMYYNPDSWAGGQYVYGEVEFPVFAEAVEAYELLNEADRLDDFVGDVEEMSDQWCSDIGSPFFEDAEVEYRGMTEYIEFTRENVLDIYRRIK